MSAKLWLVRPDDLTDDDLTRQLFSWFRQAEDDTKGEWTVKAIHEGLIDKSVGVFAAVEDDRILACAGVGTLEFDNLDKIGRFWFCVAEPNTLGRWVHHFTSIAQWMRDNGCSRIDGRFRNGWVRVLKKHGLKQTHAVCEMEL